MKTRILLPMLAVMIAAGTVIRAQDFPQEYLGLPGDNLNLYAVMKIFQESKTLEEFERVINDPERKINNLDLNGDNFVDYLMVLDFPDGDIHNIVLRVAINAKENQDVAVFTVQRFAGGNVEIQLTGDPDLYGKDYIIEPIYNDSNPGETPNPGYMGETAVVYGRNVTVVRTTPVIIASWPVIRYIYHPRYVVWRSGWYWGYYPEWWSPWRPAYWHYYYGYHYNWYNDYYAHYRRWHTHRWHHWNDRYYVSTRVYSPAVVVNINTGHYKTTYSKPETRREGEDAYYRSQPAQGRRATYSTTSPSRSNEPERRSSGNTVSSSDRRQVNTNSSVNNRTSSGVSQQAPARRNEGQGTVNREYRSVRPETTTGRPSEKTEVKSSQGNSSERRAVVPERQAPKVSQAPVSQPSRNQQVTERRPSQSSVSGRTVQSQRSSGSGSGSSKAVQSQRSSSSSKAVQSQRSSSSQSKQSDDKRKSSESSSSGRRK